MSEFKNRLRLIRDSVLVSKDDKDTEKIQNEVLLTFEEALKRYLDSLYSTAFELIGNKQETEDLIQEVCLRAFQNFYQLKSERKAKAWLYRILINTFIALLQTSFFRERKTNRKNPFSPLPLTTKWML
jgi:DNA-directed RNA polymerase specialized sigma24 family protein